MDTFYKIYCWCRNRKGSSYAVELHEDIDSFTAFYQHEEKERIPSLAENGKVDRSLSHHKFKVEKSKVISHLQELSNIKIDIIPSVTGGFDGCTYHLKIANGESIVQFSWWLNCPAPWANLNEFWLFVINEAKAT